MKLNFAPLYLLGLDVTLILGLGLPFAAADHTGLRGTVPPRKLTTSVTEVPVVGNVTTSSATIMFRTSASASVYVVFADNKNMNGQTNSTSITTVADDDFTGSIHLTELSNATNYWYRVYVDGQMHDPGTVQKFETFPDAGSTFRFSIFADSAKYTANKKADVYKYGSANPTYDGALFAAQIGDFDHSDPTNLAELRTMHRALRDIGATSGEDFATHIASKMSLVHVWDDHDVREHNCISSFACDTTVSKN